MLTFAKNVKRTKSTDKVIEKLHPYFKNIIATITSVLRDEKDQLRIITELGIKYNLLKHNETLNMSDLDIFNGKPYFKWQIIWSKLLNLKIIVSPPIRAICLLDYIRPNGENMKGKYINPSPHYYGNSFDISGPDINSIYHAVLLAQKDGIGIKNVLLERNNNAVHVDIL